VKEVVTGVCMCGVGMWSSDRAYSLFGVKALTELVSYICCHELDGWAGALAG
jgi:hypothetical protein